MTKSAALIFLVALQVALPCNARSASDQSFSKAELSIIDRNQTLQTLMKSHPQAVRQALDLMQQNRVGSRSTGSEESLQSRDESVVDPDLDELERSNPEAARDLFLLIKRVAAEKSRK
ncbi:hypothetical protein [Bradyrhizobium sp. Leo121]|uniref:hypothetical protein n=1 Tax=Bradyrhizobium sp. Leo121 TaxID=1571195 RepID=UPI001029A323|nr:hypothetical protein [Bradyrhizobium sp. Leo121]RZN32049.1 hypothetical protein CWO90_15010 [Bradyrhizobium sp. Leo121]